MKPLYIITEKISSFYEILNEKKLNKENYKMKRPEELEERLIINLNKNPFSISPGEEYLKYVELWKISQKILHFRFKEEPETPKSEFKRIARDYGLGLKDNKNKITFELDNGGFIKVGYMFISFSINPPPELDLLEDILYPCVYS